jgi:hypothetical protein
MKNLEIFKEIKGVFKPPEKATYFGRVRHGCPYFYPRNYNSTIISTRKLKLRTAEKLAEMNEKYTHLRDQPSNKYSNYPMVRRAKNKIVKLFGNEYFLEFGWPVKIKTTHLGWKDKWLTPRYEWPPSFHIYFFNLQYCVWWNAPRLEGEKYADNDAYYEMILWYLKYSDKNLKMAEESWGWTDSDTKESTWNKNYLK